MRRCPRACATGWADVPTEEEGFESETGQLDDPETWPPEDPGPEPERDPEVVRGFVVYQSTFGGMTGRAVVSSDAGLTWR